MAQQSSAGAGGELALSASGCYAWPSMSKVLVLGGSGMLGHKLCQFLPLNGHAVLATIRSSDARHSSVLKNVRLFEGTNVLDHDQLERVVQDSRADVVVNCIGIVKQLASASDKAMSVAINAWLPHRLASICRNSGSFLIHISTDCVFDGTRGRYVEGDLSDARDLYGKSKFLGEHGPEELGALTLRTSIIGRELRRPTHGLVEWFLSQKGGSVKGFAQAIYSGFTTIEMSRIIDLVIKKRPPLNGTVHVASTPVSKFDLLEMLKQAYALDVRIERDEGFVCDRSLVMEKFSEITGYRAPSWDRMVRELSNDPTPYDEIQLAK